MNPSLESQMIVQRRRLASGTVTYDWSYLRNTLGPGTERIPYDQERSVFDRVKSIYPDYQEKKSAGFVLHTCAKFINSELNSASMRTLLCGARLGQSWISRTFPDQTKKQQNALTLLAF
jgi:hypothetical protein